MKRPIVALAAAAALLLALYLAGPGVPRPGLAAGEEARGEGDYIEVLGTGEVRAAQDTAVVRLAAVREAATAAAAHREAAAAAQAVVEALRAAGVAERDIQTSGVLLQPVYDHGARGEPRLVGYRAEVSLQVTVRRVDQAGTLIDRAVAAGVNRLDGVQLSLADAARLEQEALAEAYADARARAEALARAAGVRLGRPLLVEQQGAAPPPVLIRAPAGVPVAEAVPVMPGELRVSAQVRVRFAIAR